MIGFAVRALAWSLSLFGIVRLPWIDAEAVLPLTQLQGRAADAVFGASTHAVQVTSACSGVDAFALCAGAVLAYPVTWSRRLAGVGGAVGLLLVTNVVRIATLGHAAGSPRLFDTLHVYVWPGVFTLAIAAYVFTWMYVADGRPLYPGTGVHEAPIGVAPLDYSSRSRHFVCLGVVLLVVFIAFAPMSIDNRGVLAVAAFITATTAQLLAAFGLQAGATANVLWTAHGGFLVTPDCIVTPLIPVYCAAVIAYGRRWPVTALALVAAVPLFTVLGVARLLVVALPAGLAGSPLFFVHAFYQLFAAAVLVWLAAWWRQGAGIRLWRQWILGCAAGAVAIYLTAPVYAHTALAATASLAGADPQGAIGFVPSFQIGLALALALAASVHSWRAAAIGLGLLAVAHVTFLAVLDIGSRYGLAPHARDVRVWAVLVPVLIVMGLVAHERSRQ